MNMRLRYALVLCIPLVIITTPAKGAQFVAEQVTQSDGHVHRASLYCRDDMWRIEHNDPGSIEVTIVRKDKGLMWLLLGRTKQFATVPLDESTGITFEPRWLMKSDAKPLAPRFWTAIPQQCFR